MLQLCTLMPPGGAAAAERTGGLGAVLGASGCLWGLCPLAGHGRGRGRYPAPGTRQPSPGPTWAPSAPAMGPAPRAARREQQRRLPGRAGALPARGPSRPVCARFPPVPRSAGSVCLQRGRSCGHRYGVGGPGERGNTCFQHGEGGEGQRAALPGPAAGSLPSRWL